jgi:hypothetical protein
MMSPADHIAQLECVVREQMAEIDQLRAAIGQKDQELDAVLAWIAGDADALGALRAVYVDPRASVPWKVRAATSALPFERSKPASVTVIVDFKERTRDARLRTVELRKQEWARQDARPRLDLSGPIPGTILGGDREGEALGPDPAA